MIKFLNAKKNLCTTIPGTKYSSCFLKESWPVFTITEKLTQMFLVIVALVSQDLFLAAAMHFLLLGFFSKSKKYIYKE